MFGGSDQVFGLKINFDSSKIESSNYGFECWKVFWSSFDMKVFNNMLSPKLYFFCGDSDSRIFSICFETMAMNPADKELFDSYSKRIKENPEFTRVAGSPSIEEYDKSILFTPFCHFLKTLEIEWGKLEVKNEGAAFDAIAALKIFRKE